MSKAVANKVARTTSAKQGELAAKKARAIVAHSNEVAYCNEQKISGLEKIGRVAFASTAMQADADRGKIARAILLPGKSATYTFKQVATLAKVAPDLVNRANLFYIRRNVEFRKELVGFVVDFDMSEKTISVKAYKAASVSTKPKKTKVATNTQPEAPASE